MAAWRAEYRMGWQRVREAAGRLQAPWCLLGAALQTVPPDSRPAPPQAPTSLHFQFYAKPSEGGAGAAGGAGAGGLRVIDLPAVDRLPESGAQCWGHWAAAGCGHATVAALPLWRAGGCAYSGGACAPRCVQPPQPSSAVSIAVLLSPDLQTTSCWSGWSGSTMCRQTSALRCCTRCVCMAWVGLAWLLALLAAGGVAKHPSLLHCKPLPPA